MPADQRRLAVLRAARIEFGTGGFVGTSTESIARRVGVSQPYLFRLFPTKRAIFLATVESCFDELTALFTTVAGALTGEEAFSVMGAAYNQQLDNREILQMQLQMWSMACHDDEVRDLARRRLSELWLLVERITGAEQQRIMQFFASGMLLNVFAALDLPRIKDQLGDALTGLVDVPGD